MSFTFGRFTLPLTFILASSVALDALGCVFKNADQNSSRVLSQQQIAEHSVDNYPVVSLCINPSKLWNPNTGILGSKHNRLQKGRPWERPANNFTVYENGNKVYDSPVGIRISGGASRLSKDPSFRIYFRKKTYDSKNFPKRLVYEDNAILNNKRKIKTIVLRRSNDRIPLLSFAITKNSNVDAPYIQPVRFFLNGKYWGTYHLSEHLKKKKWLQVRGMKSKRHYFTRIKNDPQPGSSDFTDYKAFKEIKRWLLKADKISLSEVHQKIDLNNFTKNILNIMFLGTSDWRQGAVYRAKNNDVWKFITWDLDHSFIDIAKKKYDSIDRSRPPYHSESFALVMTGVKWFKNVPPDPNGVRQIPFRDFASWYPRELLMYRMWTELPEFRRHFAKQLIKEASSSWSPLALSKIVTKIQDEFDKENQRFKGKLKQPEALTIAKVFIQHRSQHLLEQLKKAETIPYQQWQPISTAPDLGKQNGEYIYSFLKNNRSN